MNQNPQRQSARIYEFPAARVRAIAQNAKPIAQPRPTNVVSSQVASTSFGSGWYHEAAIEEAGRTAKS